GQNSASQRERHVNRARQRIVVIRRAWAKADARIERAGRSHPFERVELELAIADRARFVDQRAGEPVAPAFGATRRLDIEPLGLRDERTRWLGDSAAAAARIAIERPQRDAAERFALRSREPQPTE